MNRIGSREFWVPGWRQAAVFLLLVLGGLVVWTIRVPLLGYAYHSGTIPYALLALAAGFALPKGFYLWGVAIVLSHPFAAVALSAYQESRGADLMRGGAEGWAGFAFVLVAMTFVAVVPATALSTAGAGLRIFLDDLRRERPGTPHDVRAR